MNETFPMSIPAYVGEDSEEVIAAYFKAVTEGYSMDSKLKMKTDGTTTLDNTEELNMKDKHDKETLDLFIKDGEAQEDAALAAEEAKREEQYRKTHPMRYAHGYEREIVLHHDYGGDITVEQLIEKLLALDSPEAQVLMSYIEEDDVHVLYITDWVEYEGEELYNYYYEYAHQFNDNLNKLEKRLKANEDCDKRIYKYLLAEYDALIKKGDYLHE